MVGIEAKIKSRDIRNKRVGVAVACLAAGMLGLAFASVPLYKLFCQVTGYAGTPKIGGTAVAVTGPAANKVIKVMMDANVNSKLNWTFKPNLHNVNVHLGEETLATYTAKNLGDKAVTGTATFNVVPFKAAQYVSKIDCFCFTEQRLEAGQEMPMLVSFYIDPDIMDDPNTQDIDNIILSYTFFPSREQADGEEETKQDSTDGKI